jgi:hypothetical protein
MGVRTTVIDGCCFFVEGLSSTFESPIFTGADGFIDDFNFSTDDCNSCIDNNPCLDISVTLTPCSDECGTEIITGIRFGCDNSGTFNSSTLVGMVLLYSDGNCYEITEVHGETTGGTVHTIYDNCVDCVEFNPCLTTPTPTPTRTSTPTPTPTRTSTPTPTPTQPCNCNSYVITATSDTTVGYTDCSTGEILFLEMSKDETIELCSCTVPESIPPGLIFFVGETEPCLPEATE